MTSVYLLDDRVAFPPVSEADPSGILAIGGDLAPERLLVAYGSGIFPWYEDGLPILWHAPDPRMALHVEEVHIGRSLKKTLRRTEIRIRMDTA